jgi:poly(ADP-ribose) glycohydrolase ARH3
MLGDVIGAIVEGETPSQIARGYESVDEILATSDVPKLVGGMWQIGRYTDDTQMMICVAEWLAQEPPWSGKDLLARFAAAYKPWRRYGAGAAAILRAFPGREDEWEKLSTLRFPGGSYGNGSAMRVAPVGLACRDDQEKLATVAIESSRPTHVHPLAFQGAVLQSTAVATALASGDDFTSAAFILKLREALCPFSESEPGTERFSEALDQIEAGLARGAHAHEVSRLLGTGIAVDEAVSSAIYCFLSNHASYEDTIHAAVFGGGDTDTIAAMAGAISGAFLGRGAIPTRWLDAVREDEYTPEVIASLASRLLSATTEG